MTSIPYTIRRSDRARRARIQVSASGVEVVVPRRLPLREVEPFVESKQRWIERTLLRMREGEVPYLGERLRLRVRVERGRTRSHVALRGVAPSTGFDGHGAEASARRQLHVAVGEHGQEAVLHALEAWYRRRARDEVGRRLDAAVSRAGTSYTGLQIRSQRTRWASCSSDGAMSFNWRLLLAPPEILDYVVEHEVAHLDVHDHSERFWALLASRCSAYREHEAWLRANGHTLRLA
jgi:predicted metal-dependent hydrolase